MHICIDSSVFIRGLLKRDPNILAIFELIGAACFLSIPRLVAIEVTRNLDTRQQVSEFYDLFQQIDYATIVDARVPLSLAEKYTKLGLPAKADAFIGAFAEWQQVKYLVSDNRHFLRQLQTTAFTVLSPDQFMARWRAGDL